MLHGILAVHVCVYISHRLHCRSFLWFRNGLHLGCYKVINNYKPEKELQWRLCVYIYIYMSTKATYE